MTPGGRGGDSVRPIHLERFSARPLPLLNFTIRICPLVRALFQKIPKQSVPQLSLFPLELQSSSLFALHPPQLCLLFTPKLRLLLTLNLCLFLQTYKFCLLSLQLLLPHGLRTPQNQHVIQNRCNTNGSFFHLEKRMFFLSCNLFNSHVIAMVK